MNLREKEVNLDHMPTVVSGLKQEICGLKILARTLVDASGTIEVRERLYDQ